MRLPARFVRWKLVLAGMVIAAGSYAAGTLTPFSGASVQSNETTNDHLVMPILWLQTAAEARALMYQSFNMARTIFDNDLRVNRRNRMKRAVMVDADETVVDNTPYHASLVRKKAGFPSTWSDWRKTDGAVAIPGAVEFLNYATSKGATVFYVSNQRPEDRQGTIDTLKRLGFPNVTDETALVGLGSKEPRRQSVAKTHRIVLLMGDNLNDIAQVFERKPIAERKAAVDQLQQEFGRRFIVIPNPIYGEWESALYDFKPGLTNADKDAMRKSLLKVFGQ